MGAPEQADNTISALSFLCRHIQPVCSRTFQSRAVWTKLNSATEQRSKPPPQQQAAVMPDESLLLFNR